MSRLPGTSELNSLLEKTTNWDKDERYMATNDLCAALSRDVKIDENMERRICAAVLKQLDDQSNDVQSVAVKCLAIVLKKVHQAQIGEICRKLISLIIEGKDALRDIYSIGLKTLITDVPDTMGPLVADTLTGRLLLGIQATDAKDDVLRECLDNTAELLRRFGLLNERDHVKIMTIVVKQLDHERPVIRKKAANCLGALAVVSSDELLNALVDMLLAKIDSAEAAGGGSDGGALKETRTLIQTIGTISRTVGYRLGRHLEKVVPLFLRFCGDPKDESQQTDAANELRENCFPGLESFVLRCPREVTPFLPDILRVSVSFMKYDPNYSYDDDDDENGGGIVEMTTQDGDEGSESDGEDRMDEEADDDMDAGGGGGDDDDDDDAEYEEDEDFGGGGASDDDDTSWKVRKAAAKVISAVIAARPELFIQIYAICGDALVARFKEREENVRLDIINCFNSLVQVVYFLAWGAASSPQLRDLIPTTPSTSTTSAAAAAAVAVAGTGTGTGNGFKVIKGKVGLIVRSCLVCLRDPAHPLSSSSAAAAAAAAPSKCAVLAVLRSLILALKGGLDRYMNRLMGAVEKCLTDKNQALRLEALTFLRHALDYHSSLTMLPSVPRIFPLVVGIVGEDWYKIVADGLRVFSSVIRTIKPRDPVTGRFIDLGASTTADVDSYFLKIYDAVMPRLEAFDIDQEIKECAILTIGQLFSHATPPTSTTTAASSSGNHQLLLGKLPAVLLILRKRLENDTTRIPILKALIAIADSANDAESSREIGGYLSEFLVSAAPELAQYMRHQSRSLRVLALHCITSLVSAPATTVSPADLPLLAQTLVKDSSYLITDTDLHLCHLALVLSQSVLRKNPTLAATPIFEFAYPQMLKLARSSLVQGAALQSLVALFQDVTVFRCPNMCFSDVFRALYSTSPPSSTGAGQGAATAAAVMSKQSLSNLSQCVAGIIIAHVQREDEGLDGGAAAAGGDILQGAIAQFTSDLRASTSSETLKQLALHSIGDVGQHTDLSAIQPLEGAAAAAGTASCSSIQALILGCFTSAAEETKQSAAYALGHSAVGNMSAFLPTVLSSTTATATSTAYGNIDGKQQYLLLVSLREIIYVFANGQLDFLPYLDQVLPILMERSKAEDESVRNMVGECLGLLTAICCSRVLPVLLGLMSEGNVADKAARRLVAYALRIALARTSTTSTSTTNTTSSTGSASGPRSGSPSLASTATSAGTGSGAAGEEDSAAGDNGEGMVPAIAAVMDQFLPLLQDEDLEVKKAALLMVNTAVHHNPAAIYAHLLRGTVVPVLVHTLQIKLERTVDLGPFKHKVDDNLPLRKVSLACLESLLETMGAQLDVHAVLEVFPALLADKDEIKTQTHQFLMKLAEFAPGTVVGCVSSLIDPLEKTINKKINRDSNGGTPAGPEVERAFELVKSAVRVVICLGSTLDAAVLGSNRKWIEFYQRVKHSPQSSRIFQEIQGERAFDAS